ncbi:hypothetical protein Hanom_Chr12g01099091 [Helianthus anomalus]
MSPGRRTGDSLSRRRLPRGRRGRLRECIFGKPVRLFFSTGVAFDGGVQCGGFCCSLTCLFDLYFCFPVVFVLSEERGFFGGNVWLVIYKFEYQIAPGFGVNCNCLTAVFVVYI